MIIVPGKIKTISVKLTEENIREIIDVLTYQPHSVFEFCKYQDIIDKFGEALGEAEESAEKTKEQLIATPSENKSEVEDGR